MTKNAYACSGLHKEALLKSICFKQVSMAKWPRVQLTLGAVVERQRRRRDHLELGPDVGEVGIVDAQIRRLLFRRLLAALGRRRRRLVFVEEGGGKVGLGQLLADGLRDGSANLLRCCKDLSGCGRG